MSRALQLCSMPIIPREKFWKLVRNLPCPCWKNSRLFHGMQWNARYTNNKVNRNCFSFFFPPLNDVFSASLTNEGCKLRSQSYRRFCDRVLSFPSLPATSYAPLELHVFQWGLKQQITKPSMKRKETWPYLKEKAWPVLSGTKKTELEKCIACPFQVNFVLFPLWLQHAN